MAKLAIWTSLSNPVCLDLSIAVLDSSRFERVFATLASMSSLNSLRSSSCKTLSRSLASFNRWISFLRTRISLAEFPDMTWFADVPVIPLASSAGGAWLWFPALRSIRGVTRNITLETSGCPYASINSESSKKLSGRWVIISENLWPRSTFLSPRNSTRVPTITLPAFRPSMCMLLMSSPTLPATIFLYEERKLLRISLSCSNFLNSRFLNRALNVTAAASSA
mmetsp:Transcript_4778/g.6786  ORF Transcript_4778/g.6786 Transcript_4778/m.6786 type:complete len:223 (+) Transcript_4778:2071-2739(+)